jgi:hypothetical protein
MVDQDGVGDAAMESIPFLIISAILAIPGARLALLWRRTRLAPEGWLALFFIGFAIGIPIRFYLIRHPGVAPGWTEALSGIALFSLVGSVVSMLVFTRDVFRPASRFARTVSRGLAVILVTCVGIIVHDRALSIIMHPAALFANVCATPIFWWAFFECTGQYANMRRQAKLGLGNPLVRDRFLLWSLWTGALCIIPTMALVVKLVLIAGTPAGEEIVAPDGLMLVLRALVLCMSSVAGVAIWLSFFPPPRYIAWVSRRSESPGLD